MKRCLTVGAGLLCSVLFCTGQIIWQDADPTTPASDGTGSFTITSGTADPAGGGATVGRAYYPDPTHSQYRSISINGDNDGYGAPGSGTQVSSPLSGGYQYANVDSNYYDQPFAYSVEVYVPASSDLGDDNSDALNIFVRWKDAADGVVEVSPSTAANLAQRDVWQTLIVTGNSPTNPNVARVVPILSTRDANQNIPQNQTIFYVRNIDFQLAEVAPPYTVDVTLDLTRQLYIGGISALDRERILNIHDDLKPQDFTASEAADMIDTNKTRFGRVVGGFQWVRGQVTEEDPARPGYIDTNALISYCHNNQDILTTHWPWMKLGRQDFIFADQITIFPGGTNAGLFNPINNDAAAEWASIVWQHYWTDPVRPPYYEPINEPFVHKFELGTDEQGIVDFHEAMMDRVQADVPAVQVGGPCMAWPVFSKWDYDHFRNTMGRYIDQLGHKTDFLSWHIYSTLHDDGDTESHSVGANADWQLDLVENYAHNVTGRDIPLVISEFGGGLKDWQTSTILSPYSDLRDWHILKSVMGKVMGFHERPDRIVKAIPFIVGKATWFNGYETNPYPFVTHRWDGGSWVETHLPKFFEFWKDVEGDRFLVETTDPDLQAHAFVTNTAVHLCLNNIDALAQANADIAALLEPGVSVQSASLTRLYWDGSAPALSSMAPLATWTNLVLEPYEAAILHLTLNQAPSRVVQLYQKSHYGDRTMVGYTNTPQTFTVLADMNRGEIHKATLKVGVTRSFGSNVTPIVTFNGQALSQAADWPGGTQEGVPGGAGGRDQFDGSIRIPVPAGWVQASNTVDVSFDSPGGYISTVILEASSELPFEFSLAAQPDSAGVILSWDSSSALSYTVLKRTNQVFEPWSAVVTLPGTGTTLFHTNSVTNPQAFFRVQAEPL